MELMWKVLCFRFGIFVVFSLWLQGITWKTHHVTSSLIRSQRLLSFFEVSCPISCSLFLYRRNFSYPHKHNVIQTCRGYHCSGLAMGWTWASPCLSLSGNPHCPFPTQLRRLRAAPSGKMAFPLVPSHNWKSDSHSIYISASVLPYNGGLGTVAAPQLQGHWGWCWLQHRFLLSTFLEPKSCRVQGSMGNPCCIHGIHGLCILLYLP